MMKRLLLGLMLVMTAGAASAEWTAVGGSDEVFQYFDRDTIRRNGNLVKMWDLKDLKTVRTVAGGSYLSSKVQEEYDCKEERSRILVFTIFSGQMGRGNVVFTNSDGGKWSPIEPGSIAETLWKIACGKK